MNYWFRNKKYGYGWVPATWQGWLVLLGYILLSFCVFIIAEIHPSSEREMVWKFVPVFILLTLLLLLIAYKTGEKPRWRWGK